MTPRPRLVLASTSPHRRALLQRLGVEFSVADPAVPEERRTGEAPADMARRLAEAKARAVAKRFPESVVIGGDQVAVCGSEVLGKPGTHDNAVRQLRLLSGRDAVFHTAVCVHGARDGRTGTRLVPCRVSFREFDDAAIERYLAREQPYDCAGSARSEGLGISLIAKMESEDPTALVGLPLIALVDLLHEQGVDVP
ncbi:MAG TPA: nucleoside triphosphate pyrophosphatase [Burkholderiales bacterium]|nr:nucleoside triphosphate pyrophosphatase [Burkholderiales bacterium]